MNRLLPGALASNRQANPKETLAGQMHGSSATGIRLNGRDRPVVLVLVGAYLPGYKAGGPIRSIAGIVDALGQQFEFRVLTLDRDLGDCEPYRGVIPSEWVQVGDAWVFYAAPDQLSWRCVRDVLRATPHHVLYINSVFSWSMAIRPLLLRRLGHVPDVPTIVAPRGEFSPGALRLKYWKKCCFLLLARAIGLYRGVTWHATSENERVDILRIIGHDAVLRLAPALTATPSAFRTAARPSKVEGSLKVVFLSRITRKKNLGEAIRSLAEIRGAVSFDVYGPVDDPSYWSACEQLAAALNVRLSYRGPLPHELVASTLAQYDLFYLPTLGENFGHVVAEALAVGLPVLISDQTPWRGLEERGVGWDVPLSDVDRFRQILQTVSDMGETEHALWRARACAYAESRNGWTGLTEANRLLFQSAAETT